MKSYKHLSYEELVKIETLLEEDYPIHEIAIKLSRNKSTIYRCVSKNVGKNGFNADVAYTLIKSRKLDS